MKNFNFLSTIFLCSLLISTQFIAQVSAKSKLPDFKLVAEDYAPYAYLDNKDKENKIAGLSTEIVQAAMKAAKIEKEIVIEPWPTIYANLQNVPNYIAFTCGRTPEREDKFIWISEVGYYTGHIYGINSNKHKINNLDDLKKFKVGSVHDHYTQQYLLKHGFTEGQNLFTNKDDATNIEKLHNGEIDFLIANQFSISFLVEKGKLKKNHLKVFHKIKDLRIGAYFVASKGTSKEILDRFNIGFKKIKANGTYHSILKKH
ncbi:MAG: transporter substrate-binding domain-containing protein [Oligoflexia bacterium]|nr:transporter substrate-binding domain-containing protein [Oligoflexia bacterium]